MDLTLNRTLAGKSLPKGSIVISAINYGDQYQITDLDPSLVSRFNIYEFAQPMKIGWFGQTERILTIESFTSSKNIQIFWMVQMNFPIPMTCSNLKRETGSTCLGEGVEPYKIG